MLSICFVSPPWHLLNAHSQQHLFWGINSFFFGGITPLLLLIHEGSSHSCFQALACDLCRPMRLCHGTLVETKWERQPIATLLAHQENLPVQWRSHREEHSPSWKNKPKWLRIPGVSPTWNQMCLEFSVIWTNKPLCLHLRSHVTCPLTPCDFLHLN